LTPGRTAEFALTGAATPERPRYFLNNILAVGYKSAVGDESSLAASSASAKPRLPAVMVPAPDIGISDGNLYGFAGVDATAAVVIFDKYRKSPAFTESTKAYDGGFTSRSLAADPQLDDHDVPRSGSPALDAGAPIPTDWPDVLRNQDAGPPDIGALPLGAAPLRVGRDARP
jgi:hypothetical protein